MEERSKVGKRYRCVRTVCMNNNSRDIRYIKGKVYKSEVEGCITDETGLKEHLWSKLEGTFIRTSNKRRRHENSRTG